MLKARSILAGVAACAAVSSWAVSVAELRERLRTEAGFARQFETRLGRGRELGGLSEGRLALGGLFLVSQPSGEPTEMLLPQGEPVLVQRDGTAVYSLRRDAFIVRAVQPQPKVAQRPAAVGAAGDPRIAVDESEAVPVEETSAMAAAGDEDAAGQDRVSLSEPTTTTVSAAVQPRIEFAKVETGPALPSEASFLATSGLETVPPGVEPPGWNGPEVSGALGRAGLFGSLPVLYGLIAVLSHSGSGDTKPVPEPSLALASIGLIAAASRRKGE
ncbi:MAG: hypothetical protein KIT11_10875 [Fimbriimonadaceae bacterium]|nr:hypothetical protein [Fimbriimonadaceae bacterium]QYK55824.1 MAG: hypothetical protein KF733_12545 [Fimbriimonadaceae bacterium]